LGSDNDGHRREPTGDQEFEIQPTLLKKEDPSGLRGRAISVKNPF
jgi:hypothetical protein